MLDIVATLRRELIRAEFQAQAGCGRSPQQIKLRPTPRMKAAA